MATSLSLLRSLRGPVSEMMLVGLTACMACLVAYILPSIRLAEEKRVSEQFDIRFRNTVEDLQRMQEQRVLSTPTVAGQ